MNARMIGRCAAAVVLSAAGSAATADVILVDGTLADADWVSEFSGSGTSQAGQITSNGNPGSFRQVTLGTGPEVGSEPWVLHRYGMSMATRYDPATQGAITSLDWAIDFRGVSGDGQGQMLYPALKQGTTIYYADDYVMATGQSGTWESLVIEGLTAVDFQSRLDSTARPNFTVTGAPIRFGFVTESATGQRGAFTAQAGYDNFRVRVIPTPGAMSLAAGLVVVGGRRRRK